MGKAYLGVVIAAGLVSIAAMPIEAAPVVLVYLVLLGAAIGRLVREEPRPDLSFRAVLARVSVVWVPTALAAIQGAALLYPSTGAASRAPVWELTLLELFRTVGGWGAGLGLLAVLFTKDSHRPTAALGLTLALYIAILPSLIRY